MDNKLQEKVHQKSVNVLSHLISLNEVEVLPVNSIAMLKVPTLLLTPGAQFFLREGKLLVYFHNKHKCIAKYQFYLTFFFKLMHSHQIFKLWIFTKQGFDKTTQCLVLTRVWSSLRQLQKKQDRMWQKLRTLWPSNGSFFPLRSKLQQKVSDSHWSFTVG